MSPNYTYTMQWSEEDKGYIATCLELPFLSGFGRRPEKAFGEVKKAVAAALEVLKEDGERENVYHLRDSYLAACDPATILNLLTELELARAVLEAAPFATADCDGLDASCPFCLALAAYRAAYPAKEGA